MKVLPGRALVAPALALVATLIDRATAFADHPNLGDEQFFNDVFAPLVATLPPWLVVGLLPTLVIGLLVVAGFWAWRAGAAAPETATDSEDDE